MLFAVSPLWDYDTVYHWWQHSDKRFVANRMKSNSLFKDYLAPGLPRTDDALKENSEVDGCISPPMETTDEASVHVTIGYESETSPISTASLGRQKTLPQSNLCSSSQCTSRSDKMVAQEMIAIRNCDGNAVAAEDSREIGHGDFLGSSQETLKGGFSGGCPHGGLESSLLGNIPQNHNRVASLNCDDRKRSHKDSAEEVDQLLPASRRTSSCSSASISSVRNRSSDGRNVCHRSVGTAVGGNRKSFYEIGRAHV